MLINKNSVKKIESLIEEAGEVLDYVLGNFDAFKDLPNSDDVGERGIERAENILKDMANGKYKPNIQNTVNYYLTGSGYLNQSDNDFLRRMTPNLGKSNLEYEKSLIKDLYNTKGPTYDKEYALDMGPTTEKAYILNPNKNNLVNFAKSNINEQF